MKKYLAVTLAAVVGVFVLGVSTTMGQGYGKTTSSGAPASGSPSESPGAKKPGSVVEGGVIVAMPITKDEAMKKYPPPKGGYPAGDRDPHMKSGLIRSPYSPHTQFDCSKIGHGELVLDTHANKVFLRP
jgi:hypothetical protein